ncbi:SWIM-type domain-containing protein OS=Streptomyces griseomycini OX=66895 GN=FHS37_001484 PE=4 SV=1 [Streptomyces griseomycini]
MTCAQAAIVSGAAYRRWHDSQGARWTVEQVLSLAPDAASRKAGSELGAAGLWSGAGSSTEGAVWGLCKGSGSEPYRTVVDAAGPGPRTGAVARVASSRASTRRGCCCSGRPGTGWCRGGGLRSGRSSGSRADAGGGAGSGPRSTGSASGSADTEPPGRRAERRAERVTSGAPELEQRLADLLRGGLAAAEQAGYTLWEETAARMVDAQAQGWLPACVSWGRFRAPGRAGRCGCWRSARCSICWTRPGCAGRLCRSGWPRRCVRGSGCPCPRKARRCAIAGWSSRSTTPGRPAATRRVWLYGTGVAPRGAAALLGPRAVPRRSRCRSDGPGRGAAAYPGAGLPRAALGGRFAPPVPRRAAAGGYDGAARRRPRGGAAGRSVAGRGR